MSVTCVYTEVVVVMVFIFCPAWEERLRGVLLLGFEISRDDKRWRRGCGLGFIGRWGLFSKSYFSV